MAAGSQVTLACVADGTPPPTLKWQREGLTVRPDAHLSVPNQGSTLHIRSANISHTGRYTCTAANQAGEASRHYNLIVLGEVYKDTNSCTQSHIFTRTNTHQICTHVLIPYAK